ncbi:uncharacterized protein CEXT_306091 [Caerostris extrusa]|uniref:Proton-coupled folate transporter n=1 Tax=Caerostris extrusa TaxID=172846 RepID=A0AAV4V0J2_CAEEX|nr:uncharacterized protein CEXT_306091 [Caerostris extrusa]
MTLLIRFFPITDYSIGVMGVVSTMVKYIAYAFAHYGVYIYYIGNACGVLNGLVPLTIRSVISKIAEKDELGRVFSFLATCESIVPMLGTVMITKVFNATLNVYPNVTYLMVVGLLTLPLGTFLWAFYLHETNAVYGP